MVSSALGPLQGQIVVAAASVAALAATGSLVVWFTGASPDVFPGGVPIVPNTAVGILALALALWGLRRPSEVAGRLAGFAAAFALAIGLITLGEYAWGAVGGIDALLFPEATAHLPSAYPGRPSPWSAAALLALGTGLCQLAWGGGRGARAGEIATVVGAAIGYVVLLAYAYDARTVYELVPTMPMSVAAATLFLALGIGTLAARPAGTIVGAFAGPGVGSRILRWLFVPLVAAQAVLGWLVMEGVRAGAIDGALGEACVAVGNLVVFGGLIVVAARALDTAQRRRADAERAARRADGLLRHVVENAPVIVFATDVQGVVTLVVGKLGSRLRPMGPEAVGRRFAALFAGHPDVLSAFEQALVGDTRRALIQLEGEAFEVWLTPGIPGQDGEDPVVAGVIAVATDVTERLRAEEGIRRRNAQIQAILDASADGILLVDERRRVQGFNRRFLQMWDLPGELVDAADDRALVGLASGRLRDPGAFVARVDACYEESSPVTDELELADGRVLERYWAMAAAPDGTVYGRTWYFHDVTERKAMIRRLERQNEQLQVLDRAKTDFVNAITHDLRTPLTSIIGFTEFLEDEVAGTLSDQQRGFAGQILKSARRLERMVDDLLDVARIQAGTFRLQKAPADLGEVVQEVLAGLAPQASEERVQLRFTPEGHGPPAIFEFDAPRIQRVVANLIGNALRFTPAGGAVDVRLAVDGGGACVEVADGGPGIAEADVPKLFQRFSQLDAGAHRGGTGQGLWISKTIVEAHGGTIGVAPIPTGGTCFWFRLPG